jgi:hypothetical protein
MLTTRPYQHPQDFAKLAAFLSHARSAIHHAHYLHVGDLTWQLFHMLASYHPADLVQLWEDRSEEAVSQLYAAVGFEHQWSLTLYTRSSTTG